MSSAEASDEEEVYEVEALLEKRTRNGMVQYLVKWRGYDDPEENTWVDSEDCDCPDMIEEFEKKLAEKKATRQRSKSPSRTPRSSKSPSRRRSSSRSKTPTKIPSKSKSSSPPKEPTITANITLEPVMTVEVVPNDSDEENFEGIESSRQLSSSKKWLSFTLAIVLPLLVSIGAFAYIKFFQNEEKPSTVFYQFVDSIKTAINRRV